MIALLLALAASLPGSCTTYDTSDNTATRGPLQWHYRDAGAAIIWEDGTPAQVQDTFQRLLARRKASARPRPWTLKVCGG